MPNQSIPTNTAATIDVTPLVDNSTPPVLQTGIAVKMKVRRKSDGFVFDWNDLTFKAAVSVVQLLSADFTEVDAINFPGEYESNFALDTYSGLNANDVYLFTIVESSTTLISNLPQTGEIRVEVALDDATLARKYLRNDQSLVAGSSGNLETKDDDGSTTLQIWNIKDKDGLGITLGAGVPAIREPV